MWNLQWAAAVLVHYFSVKSLFGFIILFFVKEKFLLNNQLTIHNQISVGGLILNENELSKLF